MIARGDLAVECGYERLAEVQEEILWLCEAAHIPVIWATQGLESLAKSGLPSRAEITDAAMGERAECDLPYYSSRIQTYTIGGNFEEQAHDSGNCWELCRYTCWRTGSRRIVTGFGGRSAW